MKRFPSFLVSKRIILLSILGISLYVLMSYFRISIVYILAAGALSGLLFGKIFCRWACPAGLIMEIIMSLSAGTKFRQMYQYHKLGCPIAWISGLLNKLSLFRIKIDRDSCTSCGLCDKKCYIVAVEPEKFSLYNASKLDPGASYSCSRCLECVAVCPAGSLKFRN